MRKWISLLSLLALLAGCNDIVETDLSSSTMTIIIPAQNYQSVQNTVHFKWEEVEGAQSYRLQIVYPSFSNISVYVLDSSVTTLEFFVNLQPGTYEWRIRPENNGSQGPFIPVRALQIDSTNDLSTQNVSLLLPANNVYTNAVNPSFLWSSVTNADDYNIIVKQGSDWTTGTVVEDATVTSLSHTMTNNITSEGDYTWGVSAINSQSSSPFSEWSFQVDFDVPSAPSLTFPSSDTITAGQDFTYQWNRAIDNGQVTSPLADSVYVYTNSGLSALYTRFTTTQETKLDSIATVGTYWWRVKTYDEAGNIGPFSAASSFVIQ